MGSESVIRGACYTPRRIQAIARAGQRNPTRKSSCTGGSGLPAVAGPARCNSSALPPPPNSHSQQRGSSPPPFEVSPQDASKAAERRLYLARHAAKRSAGKTGTQTRPSPVGTIESSSRHFGTICERRRFLHLGA